MKKLLTLFFCMALFKTGFSQIDFAPKGGIWTFGSVSLGGAATHKIEVLEDTVINNRIFRKMSSKSTYSLSSFFNNSSTLYVTQSNDTIYKWVNNKLKYVFHFNIKINDTIHFTPNWFIDTVSIKITAKKDTTIKGLSTTYYVWEPLPCSKFTKAPFSPNFTNTIFYQFTAPNWLFFDFIGDCSGNYDGNRYYFCSYADPRINIGTPCLPSTTQNITSHISLKIFPNPVSDLIKVETPYSFQHYQIMDLTGKIHENAVYTEGENISIKNLNQGIYFLKLLDNQGNFAVKKFIKLE